MMIDFFIMGTCNGLWLFAFAGFLLNIQVDCTKMKRFLLGIYKYRNKKDDNDKELL